MAADAMLHVPGRGLGAALALLALGACSRAEPPAEPPAAPPIAVRLATVASETLPLDLEAIGTIRARTSTVVASKLAAYVVEVRVVEGSRVRAGELLVRLDDTELAARLSRAEAARQAAAHARDEAFQAVAAARAREREAEAAIAEARGGLEAARRAVEEAEAERATARAQAELAQATLARYRTLFEGEVLSRQEYDEVATRERTARAELARAEARVEGARAALVQSQARPERAAHAAEAARAEVQALASRIQGAEARIREAEAEVVRARTERDETRLAAPGPGVVVSKTVEVGELAVPGRPLLVLDDPASYRLEVPLPAVHVGKVALGQPIGVHVGDLGPEPLVGRVAEIVPAADPATRTVTVKIGLPSRPGLRSGLFGTARVPVGTAPVLLVPATALLERGQLTAVFVTDAGGVARLRYVTVGRRFGDRVEVLSGLAAGERIATSGLDRLEDGRRVAAAP
jgi:RND family efflux transporter MFP subunit